MAKSKYTEKTVQSILNFLRKGSIKKDSAILSGISEAQFYMWQQEFIKDNEGHQLKNPEFHPEFPELVEGAIAEYRNYLIGQVNNSTSKSGSIALDMLARRFPEHFREDKKIDLNVNDNSVDKLADIINELSNK